MFFSQRIPEGFQKHDGIPSVLTFEFQAHLCPLHACGIKDFFLEQLKTII